MLRRFSSAAAACHAASVSRIAKTRASMAALKAPILALSTCGAPAPAAGAGLAAPRRTLPPRQAHILLVVPRELRVAGPDAGLGGIDPLRPLVVLDDLPSHGAVPGIALPAPTPLRTGGFIGPACPTSRRREEPPQRGSDRVGRLF